MKPHTIKFVNGFIHFYTLDGSRIISEQWGDHFIAYLYDETGSPIGMQYRTSSYAEDVFDTFYFEKNLQGDIVAIYNANGTKLVTYKYDAWGNHTTYASGTSLLNSWNTNATFDETIKNLGLSLVFSGLTQGAGYLLGKYGPRILSGISQRTSNQLFTMGGIGSVWAIPAVKTGVMRFMGGVASSIANDIW